MKTALKITAILTLAFAILSFYHVEYTSFLTKICCGIGLFLFGLIHFKEQKARGQKA